MEIRRIYVFLLLIGLPYVGIADTCQCGWETCATNQRCVEQQAWDDDAQMFYTEYYCDSCPNGQVHSVNDCSLCVPLCEGYDANVCPPDVAPGKKCKSASCSPSGCEKYEVCNPTTGEIEAPVLVGDNCHFEGDNHTCQPNTVSCNGHFGIDSNVSGCGSDQPTCSALNSGNNATWNGSKWDVSACECDTTDDFDIASKNCKGKYRLKPSSSNTNVTTVNTAIKFSCSASKYYCTKCEDNSVGRCPAGIIANSASGQCYNFDEPNSDYVACKCTPVQVDYYTVSGSFEINYPLTGNTTDCPHQCPDGMGTGGATGQISSDGTDVCTDPSTTLIFEDGTGKFRLSGEECSNP